MKENHNIRKTVSRAALLGLLATLAACGGSKEENPCGATNLAEAFFCMLDDALNGSGPSQAPITGKAEPVGLDEFEPNSSLDNANIVTMPTGRTDSSAGAHIDGSVHGTEDFADYFIFTPDRSSNFSVYLCADTCDAVLQDDGVYIMIYDQSQTTIASTPVGSIATQQLAADLTAGLAYYVEVRGYNIGHTSYDYRLVITD